MITKKQLERNFDKFNLPVIDENIKITKITKEVVKLSDVATDSVLKQSRETDDIGKRVKSLKTSFKGGVDYNQPIPIVKRRKDGTLSLSLIDAFGRFEMFDDNKQEYWVMAVVECGGQAEIQLRGWANRVLPKEPNTMMDNVNNIAKQVEDRYITPTRKNFEEQLDIIEPHKSEEEKLQILSTLMEKFPKTKAVPKEKRFISYRTPTIMKNWVKPHFADANRLGFKLAPNGKTKLSEKADCYYGVNESGSEIRKVLAAVDRYVNKGKTTRLLSFISGRFLTSVKSMKSKRKATKSSFTKIQNNLDKLYENGKPDWNEVIDHMGFIPQHTSENIKDPI
tara:strand:+ start:66 stop:1076 length:1011 start_codon:yes stop_codon:yes gene_type:complete